jgi:hypothetical protein
MSALKSLNSKNRKITQKAKNNVQRESFFGKASDANEKQFQVDALAETGPYLAKVLLVYNEDNGGKIRHDSAFSGVLQNIGNFLGDLVGANAPAVLTVKARLVDVYDAAIPEPDLIGKEAIESLTDKKSIVFIEMHDTFVALTDDVNSLTLKAGDIIVVDYRDKKNKKNGYIVGKYWDSPVDAITEALANSAEAVSDIARAAASAVVASVTNKNSGKCGYVYEEEDCVNGQTISYTVSGVSIRDKDNVVKRLDALKKSTVSSLRDYKITEDKGSYAMFDITYELTKYQKICGHPEFIKLVQKMFETLVDSYIKTGYSNPRPHVPALLIVTDSCRTYEMQLGLRKKYCKFPSEAEYVNSTQTTSGGPSGKGYCDRDVGRPSKAVVPGHQRGEAIDLQFADISLFERTNQVSLIPNKSNQEDLQKQFDNELRIKIASMTKLMVDNKERTLIPLTSGTEGWHFSTNGK